MCKKIEIIIPEGINSSAQVELYVQNFCEENGFKADDIYSDKYIELIFPSSITTIEKINNSWLANNVKKIIFKENLIEIKKYAFNSYKKLSDVIFPNSLTNIESYAFSGCNLKSIEFGNNLKVIGRNAFSYNFLLKEVNFNKCSYLHSIGREAFSFTSIETINLSNTICDYSENQTKYFLTDRIEIIKPYFLSN